MQLETFLIALTTIIATITASVAIVKKSREYNMCVFLCKEFFVLALGIFFAFVALYIVEPEDAKTPAFIITFAISVLFSA
ncbi:hypothetical protein EBS02_09700, partial [bacterium]|nr:hypothetical protein [bacterium]